MSLTFQQQYVLQKQIKIRTNTLKKVRYQIIIPNKINVYVYVCVCLMGNTNFNVDGVEVGRGGGGEEYTKNCNYDGGGVN